MKKRDFNIVLSISREISLRDRIVKDKTRYTRKEKHKKILKDS